MKFQVHRDVFSEAVSFAVKLLNSRPTLPILAGVLIEANGDRITLSTFDYEVSSRAEVTASVEQPGTVLVHGRLLADIAGRLPNAPVSLVLEDSRVKISCGAANFTLACMPVEEYPNVPEVPSESGKVPAEEFANAISQVAIAASRDDVTPVITGVQLQFADNTMSLVATDRYRVAVREIQWEGTSKEERAALVPARIIQEVGKTFAGDGTISIALSNTDDREIIAFTADKKTVTSLLIKGNYPPVHKLFPEVVEDYAVVNTTELIDASRRVALVLERDSALRFTFTQDGVTLEALGSENAQASETLDIVLHGGDNTVSLKPQFLIDALSSVHSEFVRLSFTKTDNPNKPGPVLITAQTSREGDGEGNYRYLLQPNLLLR